MDKVVLGMSGGVDSSVAAIILQNQGYEVIGITFKFIDDFDETRVIEVCKKLNIEHHIIDYRDVFKKEVIDEFIKDYKRGITPNPCVICNKKVKINFLYNEMLNFKANYMATGHYARVEDNRLYKSKSTSKDQTYFLSEVPKKQLSKILFPLEGLEKDDVRKIAREKGLLNANDKDSTDVCFINENFRDYIANEIKSNPGDVIDINTNKKIGIHNGLSYYTIGQRRGLNIGGTKDRLFVVGKNIDENILYVSMGGDSDALISDSCILTEVNFISNEKILNCKACFRYHGKEIDVDIEYLDDDQVLVKYKEGARAVTPGQACVFYKDNECLGGGIIKEVRKNNKKLWYL